MLNNPIIQDLLCKLKEPLPGAEAQFEMAHINREKTELKNILAENYKNSAVLLLLVKNERGFYIPLTERHDYEGVHSGQISLPGGKKEEGDLTLESTALRECFEETGLKGEIKILGNLTPVYIPVSKFMVHPFVGVYNETKVDFRTDDTEVKNLLQLGLDELKNPAIIKQTVVNTWSGYKLKTPYFDVQGKVVWGATAMILNEFKKLL